MASQTYTNSKTSSELLKIFLPSTDWFKCHETIKLTIDKMLLRFCFTEWSKIKAYLYNVIPSNCVVNIIMTYLQKWTVGESSSSLSRVLKPSQHIGKAERWKFAFRWSPLKGFITVIGFADSHGNCIGLGSDGLIKPESRAGIDTSTPQWCNGEVVLMVLDTQNWWITFHAAGVDTGRKLESRSIEFPLRVGFWRESTSNQLSYGGIREMFATSDSSEIEEVDYIVSEIEVLDGLCVSR